MGAEAEGGLISVHLLLAIVGGVVLLGLFYAAQTNLYGLLDKFCSAAPFLCGGDITDLHTGEAVESTRALACAATVVGTGKQDKCLLDFAGPSPGAASSDPSSPSSTDKLKPDTRSESASVNCKIKTSGDYECDVKGFSLPQAVGEAEKWIAGYGDPEYLVYWQDFLSGEDAAWTSYASVLENVFTVVLFAIPFGQLGKAVGIGAREAIAIPIRATAGAAKKAFKATVRTITGKGEQVVITDISESAATKTAGEIGKSVEMNFAKAAKTSTGTVFEIDEGGTIIFGSEMKKKARLSIWEKIFSRESRISTRFQEKMRKHYETDLFKVIKMAGVAGAADLVYAWLDSINEKFRTYHNKIVLKRPYGEAVKIDVDTGVENQLGRPLILDKEEDAAFYQASPCRTDISVKKGYARCDGQYQYDKAKGSISCKRPVTLPDTNNLPLCGFGPEVDRETGVPVYERALALFNDIEDRKLFEQTEGDMMPTKIYLPWKKSGVFLDQFEKIDDPNSLSGLRFVLPISEATVYSATVNEDSLPALEMKPADKSGLKPYELDKGMVFDDGNVVLKDKTEYIIRIQGTGGGVRVQVYDPLLCSGENKVYGSKGHLDCLEIKRLQADLPTNALKDGRKVNTFNNQLLNLIGEIKNNQLGEETVKIKFNINTDVRRKDFFLPDSFGPMDIQVDYLGYLNQNLICFDRGFPDSRVEKGCIIYKAASKDLPASMDITIPKEAKEKYREYLRDPEGVAYEFVQDDNGRFYMERAWVADILGDFPLANGRQAVELIDSSKSRGFDTFVVRHTGNDPLLAFFDTRKISMAQDFDMDGEPEIFGGTGCKVPSVIAVSEKGKYPDSPNYCHYEKSWLGKAVTAGAIIADVALIYFGAPVAVTVGVGLINGYAAVVANRIDRWPG